MCTEKESDRDRPVGERGGGKKRGSEGGWVEREERERRGGGERRGPHFSPIVVAVQLDNSTLEKPFFSE